ncbi:MULTISPECIES: hypothetical protein [Haloferacaceae]|uniref:Uncharacterized protein n=1 Tax=Halorubrum glutamatedens TaxID=2707018 RepID=A0ABD5QNJ6_9EURY|nr:hypothetical protein [Halobellus captivus]
MRTNDGRLEHVADLESRRATVAETAEASASVMATTTVDVLKMEITYSRTVTADGSGNYSVRVLYPQTYEISDEEVTVNEEDMRFGNEAEILRYYR